MTTPREPPAMPPSPDAAPSHAGNVGNAATGEFIDPMAYTGPPSYSQPPTYAVVRPSGWAPDGAPDHLGPDEGYYPGYSLYHPVSIPDYVEERRPRANRRVAGWIALATVLVVGAAAATVGAFHHGRSTSHAVHVVDAPGGGVIYTTEAGHFTAWFPSAPVPVALKESVGKTELTIRGAADPADHEEVEESDQRVPAAETDDFLHDTWQGYAAASGRYIYGQTETVFQGQPASQVQFNDADGTLLSGLVVSYDTDRIFVLIAPTGPQFDSLTSSFVALP